MIRTHLVTGVTGQDGILLARLLQAKGDRVIGTVRPGADRSLDCYLGGVQLEEHDVRDISGFADLITRHQVNVVHNLAALSSVAASWDNPDATREVNHAAVVGMLEALNTMGADAPAFVQASTSEIFGPVEDPINAVDEGTPLNPVSPYAESKAFAHTAVVTARVNGIRASNLILFGHTSPLQGRQFVLPSITQQAAEVALEQRERIELRNPGVRRDWGSAADYVRAFPLAASAASGDYVIATGELNQLSEISRWALEAAGVPATPAIRSDDEQRPQDFGELRGSYVKASRELGWSPTVPLRKEIHRMVAVARERLSSGRTEDPTWLSSAKY